MNLYENGYISSEKPTVSIVIPTYNRGHLIGEAIKSILNQTYQDFEIIVVDDGSIDNTENVVNNIKDKRIRYIRYEKNKGAAAARNIGIKAANGEYIGFQDTDDEWLPEKLEKQMKAFDNASLDVGVVYTGHYRINGDERNYVPSHRVIKKNGYIHNELITKDFGFVITPSAVVRKNCFEKSGLFDEQLPRLQEWELFIRLSKNHHFKCIDEPLLNSYCESDSISTNSEALIIALELILNKHLEDFKCDRKALSKHYYTIGIFLCMNNNFKDGIIYLYRAVKTDPFNIRYLVIVFYRFLIKTFIARLPYISEK